jgi:RNA polymerase sigma factor (sigma-70 family)
MTDDAQQLSRFAREGDEAAFRELVVRHFDLAYSTALRQLNGDAQLAEDVAQSVFTDLARKARLLPRNVVLTGWLYEAACFAAAKAVRTEQRRRAREQEALAMLQFTREPEPEWERLRPVLDAAMGKLSAKDRNAVLLHYFERKDFRAVGAALRVTDDAAQKRVSRALRKLRAILARSGVTASASSLAVLLSTAGVPSAPAGLALSVAKTSLGAAAAAPASVAMVLMETLASFRALLLGASILVLFLGGSIAHLVYARHPAEHRHFTTLDLSHSQNGDLQNSWTPAYGNNHLAALGQGKRIFKGVPFDIQGVIQLQGQEFKRRGYPLPESIIGIPVGSCARSLYVLHANSGTDDPVGTTVASLVLHYSDGQQTELAIRHGIHLLDWWDWPDAPVRATKDPNTAVAWTGRNPPAEHHGARIRLFETRFVNPEPEKQIQTIDYVSGMANSAPFMVALTIDR